MIGREHPSRIDGGGSMRQVLESCWRPQGDIGRDVMC
jgi:hypothetical protein